MQIRCYRCGWSFAIKKEEAAFALQALEEAHGTHYDSNCPRCRHSNRISLEQLKNASPSAGEESASAEVKDAAEVAEAETEPEPDRKPEADRELETDTELEADRELADVAKPEVSVQGAQAKSEKAEPKKRRRRRG